MSYYNLSRDYHQLYELVKAGNTIVGFADYGESTLRDVVKITLRGKRITSGIIRGIIIGCRGIEYGGTFADDYDEFIEHCQVCNLEWITGTEL